MTTGEQQSSISEDQVTVSPGSMLAAAREKAGLSQDQVASELYMTPGKVKALEADDFDRLHSPTFVRGYLRAYAQLLKLDPELLVAAFDERTKSSGEMPVSKSVATDSSGQRIWQFTALVLSALLLIWLASVWFFEPKDQSDYAPVNSELMSPGVDQEQQLPAPVDDEVVSPATTETEIGAAETAPAPAVESSEGSAKVMPQVEQAISANETIAPQTPSLASANTNTTSTTGLDQLRFEFAEECWLEVSDANGDVLAIELERAGTQIQLQGRSPFNIKLGNAAGAKVFLNGQPVEIPVSSDSRVASIKIGE